MIRLFVDTNILLDVFMNRSLFYHDSIQIWSIAELRQAQVFIGAISFNNCYYVANKHEGRERAEQVIRLLQAIFIPVDMTREVLIQAINSGFVDFEDAIQYH